MRILLADVPRMLREIVDEIVAGESDLEVVGEVPASQQLLAAAEQTAAGFVIVGLDDGELPEQCEIFLRTHPHLKVLAVSGDGRQAFLCSPRQRIEPIGELSPSTLLAAIRAGRRDGGYEAEA
jgi:DNA-binding NarL/FixJ family response regulator